MQSWPTSKVPSSFWCLFPVVATWFLLDSAYSLLPLFAWNSHLALFWAAIDPNQILYKPMVFTVYRERDLTSEDLVSSVSTINYSVYSHLNPLLQYTLSKRGGIWRKHPKIRTESSNVSHSLYIALLWSLYLLPSIAKESFSDDDWAWTRLWSTIIKECH